jgi:hypothetical protein
MTTAVLIGHIGLLQKRMAVKLVIAPGFVNQKKFDGGVGRYPGRRAGTGSDMWNNMNNAAPFG